MPLCLDIDNSCDECRPFLLCSR